MEKEFVMKAAMFVSADILRPKEQKSVMSLCLLRYFPVHSSKDTGLVKEHKTITA